MESAGDYAAWTAGRTVAIEMASSSGRQKRRTALDMDDVERRIRAAMWLAGITDFPELARRIEERQLARGLGATNLRQLRGQAQGWQLRAIAAACELPAEWFTVDLRRLPELAGGARRDPPADLPGRVAALEIDVVNLAQEVHRLADAVERSTPGRDLPAQP